MLLQTERRAFEGAGHVEGAVAVLPAAVAERDHDLAFRHELAVEPGDALIAELLGHENLLPTEPIIARNGDAPPDSGRARGARRGGACSGAGRHVARPGIASAHRRA